MPYIDDNDGEFEMARPTGVVGSVAITYIQGRGTSVRVVAVPGSTEEQFAEDADVAGLCDCSLDAPAVWTFTAIPADPSAPIKQAVSIDVHEATGFLEEPEQLLTLAEGWYGTTLVSDLCLVSDDGTETLSMLMAEMHGSLIRSGVDPAVLGMKEDAVTTDEVAEFDVDAFLALLRDEPDDDGVK